MALLAKGITATGIDLRSSSGIGTMARWTTLAVVVGIAVVAVGLATRVTVVNSVVIALVIAIVVTNALNERDPNTDVTNFFLTRWLKGVVILLGAGIDLGLMAEAGGATLAVITAAVLVALFVAQWIGRVMGLTPSASVLIAVGTAICGASAIAAIAPIVKATREEIGMSLATIFAFNAIALITFPVIGAALGLSQLSFGIWAGVGVHDTASALATGFAYGDQAGEIATLVKLARTLFLVPIIVVLASTVSGKDPRMTGPRRVVGSFPWFVVGFLILAIANTADLLGNAAPVLDRVAKFGIVLVVIAVGLTLRIGRIAGFGRNLAATGIAASLSASAVALWMVY